MYCRLASAQPSHIVCNLPTRTASDTEEKQRDCGTKQVQKEQSRGKQRQNIGQLTDPHFMIKIVQDRHIFYPCDLAPCCRVKAEIYTMYYIFAGLDLYYTGPAQHIT